MSEYFIEPLEYVKVKEKLKEFCESDTGRMQVEKLVPSCDLSTVRLLKMETTEARNLLDKASRIPSFYSLYNIERIINKLDLGVVFQADEFKYIVEIINNSNDLEEYMCARRTSSPLISSYARSLYNLDELKEKINSCIKNDMIDDRASSILYKLRGQIKAVKEQIKIRLDNIVRTPSFSRCITGSISIRNGRYVIPVKREFKRTIDGDILDISDTGSTVFLEPRAIKNLHEELKLAESEHNKEEQRILNNLTAIVKSYDKRLKINIQIIAYYDFIFAKGKYSQFIRGRSVKLNDRQFLKIDGGVHPLLGNNAVPLDFVIGKGYRCMVITGPNTGGKTVALKTVGLLCLMVQSGLHIPCGEDSDFCIFKNFLVDIGDAQSIENSLSTFSAHIKNIIDIVDNAKKDTLIIIDELGTGTDPEEGMGIAIAVLEELYKKGAIIVVSTHHSEIKKFAAKNKGFQNGRMDFDKDTLRTLYKLVIGDYGESNGISIALKLGLNARIVKRAREIVNSRKVSEENADGKKHI